MTSSGLLDPDLPARQPTCHPIVKSIGGKWYWRRQIMPHFPRGLREVVSPFLGGGSIELTLAANSVRVHGSDLLYPLVCGWNLLLTEPARAADAIVAFREEYDLGDLKAAKDRLIDLVEGRGPPDVIGGLFLGLNLSTFNGILSGGPRGRQAAASGYVTGEVFLGRVRSFLAPYLAFPVRHRDYAATLAAHGDVFAYLDPPYHLGENEALYGLTGALHRGFDHEAFAEVALAHPGGCLISYDDRREIRALYEGRPGVEVRRVEGIYKGRLVRVDEDGTPLDECEDVTQTDWEHARRVNPPATELIIRRMPR